MMDEYPGQSLEDEDFCGGWLVAIMVACAMALCGLVPALIYYGAKALL